MENVIASPIREFSEKAGKCLLEYETLYHSSRLSMSEEDYTQFTRLLMDDSASDADDEITDTSHEELNSSAEVYKPKNVYSIKDGNKPFTLIIKKQQTTNNIDDVSDKSEDARNIVNGEVISGNRTCKLSLFNFEHVNNTLETVALDHVSMQEEKSQNNGEAHYKPPESIERKTFPLQDFNRFYDETNKILQKLCDPAISGYEANCESEDEVGSNVEASNGILTNLHCNTGFDEHSTVQKNNLANIQLTSPIRNSTAVNKDEDELNCICCSSINDVILNKSCTHKVNELTSNDNVISAVEYNDIKANEDLHESESGMEYFHKSSCILDYNYTNNQVSPLCAIQHDDVCLAVNLYANEFTCSEINDTNVHLGDKSNTSTVSDVRNATEGGEQNIGDNEIREKYKSNNGSNGGISKSSEIIENECEVPSHVVHKAQTETAAENEITSDAFHESLSEERNEQIAENEITSDAFHESLSEERNEPSAENEINSGVLHELLFEETNDLVAYSLDVTENSSKLVQTFLRCESMEDLQMCDFYHNKHTEQRAVVEQPVIEEDVSAINFLNDNFGIDHAVLLSPPKLPVNEKIKQNEVVHSDNTMLEEEEYKTSEASTDKCQSEAGTSFYESEIPLSNLSPAAAQKEDGASTLEPLGKCNVVSKLETKSKDDRTLPADSFVDDAMDCSYNDSSSCLDRSPLLFSSDDENYYYTEDSIAADTSKSCESQNQTQQERRKLRRLQLALAGVPPPPSVTIPQLDVNEILKLIKENQKLMTLDGSSEKKEGSPDGKEHKRPLTTFCKEEVNNLAWPEAKSCNFYGVQYNNGKLSEELEGLYERLRDRYVGCETLSSCNIWFPGISTKAIEKKIKRRNIGQSPGRRLSHLAKRRQAFSSANLLPSVAGSLPSAAACRGYNRLIMVEVKKGDHRTKAKGQPVKKAALNVNNKLQQTKRALFKSPPSGRKKVSSASKNKSSSKKIKREVDRSKVYNSKRALWPSSGKSENTVPDSNNSRQLKRHRESSEDELRHNKFPRRSLFGEREREKESNDPKLLHNNSSNGQMLSQQHKKKLLWAVAETLRTKGVSMNHPSFRALASSLARKVCSSLPDMSKRRDGRTSEFMLQISKEHVDSILKTTALQDKTN